MSETPGRHKRKGILLTPYWYVWDGYARRKGARYLYIEKWFICTHIQVIRQHAAKFTIVEPEMGKVESGPPTLLFCPVPLIPGTAVKFTFHNLDRKRALRRNRCRVILGGMVAPSPSQPRRGKGGR